MNAIFKKNLTFLETNFPHVYHNVVSFNQEKSRINVEVCQTRNGLPNMKLNTDRTSIYLHSNYNPEKEVESLIKSIVIENKDTMMILGFGMGYHIAKLAQLYPNKNKLIIEPNMEIFSKVIENVDVTKILKAKNTQILISDNDEQIHNEFLEYYKSGRFSAVEFVILPTYNRLFGPMWEEVKNKYVKFMRTFTVNVRTKAVWENAWLSNFFANLKHVPESADLADFLNEFRDIPAIMVSAGPSLSKNIALLREVGDKALIIAAGTAISVLQRENIKPHIMLGIDGSYKMSDVYNKVEWNDILFAYVLNLHYQSLDHYDGPKIYIRSNAEQQVEWLERSINHPTPFVNSGGSCANVALDFLKKLGCNPVIFIGQDLAYTNMQTHAEGHAYRQKVGELGLDLNKLKLTKDIYGNDLYTADHWMSMGYCFENYIAAVPKDNIFINATEGGYPIAGAINRTLREVIDKYCLKDIGVESRINALWASSAEKNTHLRENILKFINMVYRHSEKLTELAEKRFKLVDKIEKNIEKNSLGLVAQQSKKLNALTEKLEKNLLYREVLAQVCYEMILIIKNSTEASVSNCYNTKEKYKILYEGLKRQFQEVEEKNKTIAFASKEALKRMGEEE